MTPRMYEIRHGDRRDTCPVCLLSVRVDSGGLFRRHTIDRNEGPICAHSRGVSALPDRRAAPRLDRVDIIKQRALKLAKERT